MNILHSLRLVVDGQFAILVPDDGRREQLHRVVMLDGHTIFRFELNRGCSEGFIRVASRRRNVLLWLTGFFALFIQVGDMRRVVVFDPDERRRVTRQLEAVGDDERDGLCAVLDRVVV